MQRFLQHKLLNKHAQNRGTVERYFWYGVNFFCVKKGVVYKVETFIRHITKYQRVLFP